MEPDVLLLDEPSSFLDPRGRRELIGLINDLPMAKVIATHDLELIVATCTRVVLLDQGEVVAEGPTREILTDAEVLDKHGLEVPHSLTHPHAHKPTSRKSPDEP
jgi:cobalt/nickel transport system ATP-binding protein